MPEESEYYTKRAANLCKMANYEVIVSDFGGVLTTPLRDAFKAIERETQVSMEHYGLAMGRLAEESGRHPLFELECGRISEKEFLADVERTLIQELGRDLSIERFRDAYFEALHPNHTVVALMQELKADGYRMALLTNNVKEWRPIWESKLPVSEIFEVIVDSAFVNMRKPEHGIYRRVLEELGHGEPATCLFVDDVKPNCIAAEEVGMRAVHFQGTEQAVTEIKGHLNGAQPR